MPARLVSALLVCLVCTVAIAGEEAAPADPNRLVVEAEMAGICGFEDYWDRPVMVAEDGATQIKGPKAFGKGPVADWTTEEPGAPVFDAVHRRLLVRFPAAAEAIAQRLGDGKTVESAAIEFRFVDTEYYPIGYRMPSGMSFLGRQWIENPPRWHAVAHLLRQPWRADEKLGPTFNASVNGRRYWDHFGAQDTDADRYGRQFGPTEISHEVTTSRMDVTAAVTDEAFGETLGQRLRALSDQGFILRKWETYDARFNRGGYEYAGAPGHRGILIKAPRLVVTFTDGEAGLGDLPPAAEPARLPKRGAPTAVMPDEAQIRAYIEEYAPQRREEMPLWQWRRLQELFRLDRGGAGGFPQTVEGYYKWLSHWNRMPYRQFTGHHTPLSTHDILLYGEAMPAPVREHMVKYWEAWLMPGRPYTELQHNQWRIWTKPENSYYARTGDWRGNHSFYRGSYTRFISTMNFNHNAVMGALLGGRVIGDEESLRDGRFGLERILLRLWSWYDGTTQESIDHYYLGLTLYGQKSFADLGPAPIDRAMGRSMLLKTTDELASCFHPALKRFIATSGRSGVAELFCINEGVNCIMHTVSKRGALHDVGNDDRLGCPIHGRDLPPALVARQALVGPWMPRWMGNIVDDKPLPFELTATFKQWGKHREKPVWKRSFLGHYYGLSSRDVVGGNEIIPFMAQWRREPGATARIQEIGTLLARYGLNRTEFYDSLWHGSAKRNPNGIVGAQGGYLACLQHRNKALVLMSPYRDLAVKGRKAPEEVRSFQSSIALANYQDDPSWTLYIDGEPADLSNLPISLAEGSRITIRDGVTFLGIIPVPATDLGRTEALRITDGGAPVELQGGGEAAPTLIINNYNYYNPETPFPRAELGENEELAERVARAYGGFVVEFADTADVPDFETFQRHIAAAELTAEPDEDGEMVRLTYRSGQDLLEAGFRPQYAGSRWGQEAPTDRCFPYRRVNGAWPYLPEGMERDSSVGQQGRTGRLAKNGAALTFQPGLMGYLLTDPAGGNVLFSNPLPDPQYLVMDAPGGVTIKADGKVGLLHCLLNEKEGALDFQYAVKENQTGPGMAEALYLFGLAERPVVTRNGKPAVDLQLVELEDQAAWRVPLLAGAPRRPSEEVIRRYEHQALQQLAALSAVTKTEAALEYLPGQEPYLLSQPRSGAYEFWRQWPAPSPYFVTLPGERYIATDGNLALQRLLVDPQANSLIADYAPYLQRQKETGEPIENRARALLLFGFEEAPSAVLHGRRHEGEVASVTLDGQQAYVYPLFADEADEVLDGLEARYRAAMETLKTSRAGE